MHPAFRLGLAAIPLLVVGASAWRGQADPRVDIGRITPDQRVPSPSETDAPYLRIATHNLAHGRRLAAYQTFVSREQFGSNLRLAGDVLAREAADVVALQEADGPSVWSGHFDHVESLAEYADYPHRFRGTHARVGQPMPMDYGTAIVARVALSDSKSVSFGDNWRDSKGFVVSTVDVPGLGRPVDVVSVHLDFMRTGVRKRQVETLISELQNRGRPLILVGDLNCDSDSAPWKRLVSALNLHSADEALLEPTYPTTEPKTRIDWVLVSDELEIRSQRVLADPISDHRGIVADIGLAAD